MPHEHLLLQNSILQPHIGDIKNCSSARDTAHNVRYGFANYLAIYLFCRLVILATGTFLHSVLDDTDTPKERRPQLDTHLVQLSSNFNHQTAHIISIITI
jgi:hypothetical protein